MAAGDPTGPDLASVTVFTDSLGPLVWDTFTFDTPITLVAGRQYAIVVGSSGHILGDQLELDQDTAAGYAGGLKAISSDNGATWTQSPTRDLSFITNSAGGQQEAFETWDAFQTLYTPFYVAQTFTATSNYDIVSVELRIHVFIADPTDTVIVSIRDTEAGKAINPNPSDTVTGVSVNKLSLSWDTGGNTESYNVYFGVSGNMSLVSSTQVSTSWSISNLPLLYGTAYQWRVDSNHGGSTVTGDTWSFTTLSLAPPIITATVRRLCAVANGTFWYEDI